MKKKIAYCLPSLYIAGGMERVLCLKANYLARAGYEIYLILTDGKDKKIWYELEPEIKIIHLDINFDELWHLPLLKKITVYLRKQKIYKQRLKQCLDEIHPDITISTLRREINFINQLKDGSRKVGEIHVNRKNYRNFNGQNPSFFKKLLQQYWTRQFLRKIKQLDRFVVLCEEDKKQYPELKNICVISNPLTFFPDKVSDGNSKQILAVGRYEPQKGFDLLLQAWQKVHREFPDYTLAIYGAGDHAPYDRIVRELHLEDSCRLNGPVENITEKYLESCLFVLSSRFEGFGMVITEAMACGVPAVSFSCPCGPRDIIRDGEDGLLVENGNIEELSEKIIYMLQHPNKRKEMGKAARKNVERFRMQSIGKQWIELFNQLDK